MGHAFMNKLHGLSTTQLVTIAQHMLASLRVKDLQIYLSDPQAEALLSKLGFDGTLAHGAGDALSIVDDDLSGNKSNLFTALAYKDVVTLDTQGAATHNLTITYKFDSSTHPELRRYLYGRRVYRTYLRIYTSPDAKLSALDGFSERLQQFQQINKSDEPGRQMWGGYVYVRDGVFYTLHFTWSAPPRWPRGTPLANGIMRCRSSGSQASMNTSICRLLLRTPQRQRLAILARWIKIVSSVFPPRRGDTRLASAAPIACSDLALATPPHLVASVY